MQSPPQFDWHRSHESTLMPFPQSNVATWRQNCIRLFVWKKIYQLIDILIKCLYWYATWFDIKWSVTWNTGSLYWIPAKLIRVKTIAVSHNAPTEASIALAFIKSHWSSSVHGWFRINTRFSINSRILLRQQKISNEKNIYLFLTCNISKMT